MAETNVYYSIVTSILKSPHRKIESLLPIHSEVRELDPIFYTKFAIWYKDNGSIRDHSKLFAGGVLTGPYPEIRPVTKTLLSGVNPKLFHDTVIVALDKWGAKTGGKFRRLRGITEEYLRKEEKRAEKDYGIRFLRNATFFRELYRRLHIRPNERAAKSLRFRAPIGTEPYPAFVAIKEIAKTNDEAKICTLIEELHLPPLQVIGSVKELTPAIAATLMETMSPSELVNFTKLLERKGILNDPEVLRIYKAKITKSKRPVSLRAKKAVEAVDVDIEEILDRIINKLDTIKYKIAICIDRSYSMTQAIALGKEVATILSAKVENPEENLLILLINDHAEKLHLPKSMDYTGFELAFRYVNAVGTTSLGIAITALEKLNYKLDRVLLITDGKENRPPYLKRKLDGSNILDGSKLIICYVGKDYTPVELPSDIDRKGIEVESFEYDADYYALPNLLKLITSGGLRELVEEINNIKIEDYLPIQVATSIV